MITYFSSHKQLQHSTDQYHKKKGKKKEKRNEKRNPETKERKEKVKSTQQSQNDVSNTAEL